MFVSTDLLNGISWHRASMVLLHIARASVFPNAWYNGLEAEEMFFHTAVR
jgi:hypothetical protein